MTRSLYIVSNFAKDWLFPGHFRSQLLQVSSSLCWAPDGLLHLPSGFLLSACVLWICICCGQTIDDMATFLWKSALYFIHPRAHKIVQKLRLVFQKTARSFFAHNFNMMAFIELRCMSLSDSNRPDKPIFCCWSYRRVLIILCLSQEVSATEPPLELQDLSQAQNHKEAVARLSLRFFVLTLRFHCKAGLIAVRALICLSLSLLFPSHSTRGLATDIRKPCWALPVFFIRVPLAQIKLVSLFYFLFFV